MNHQCALAPQITEARLRHADPEAFDLGRSAWWRGLHREEVPDHPSREDWLAGWDWEEVR